jgi:flagellin FlaB
VRGVKISIKKLLLIKNSASIGIGSLIIFIAMILVAGVTAQVLIQTMGSLQEQALNTGTETLKDISGGIDVSQVSGYYNGSTISLFAIFVSPTAASDDIDLNEAYISLSDSSTKVILNYTTTVFNSTVTDGLFGTPDDHKLGSSNFGILVIRDTDSSCSQTDPVINGRDLVVLLVNTSECFSGVGTNTEVFGNVYPEYGISGVIGFTTPSGLFDTIIDLQ